MKVVVLGATGMLGHMVAQVLALSPDIDVIGTYRQARISDIGLPRRIRLVGLDARRSRTNRLPRSWTAASGWSTRSV